MRPYKLTDEQWQQTDHLLPDIRGTNEGNAITTTNVPIGTSRLRLLATNEVAIISAASRAISTGRCKQPAERRLSARFVPMRLTEAARLGQVLFF